MINLYRASKIDELAITYTSLNRLTMIDIKAALSNAFSVELKTTITSTYKDHQVDINTWIFIPNSIDINPNTYTKENFYTDVKSKVRLITPIFSLPQLIHPQSIPFNNLKASIEALSLQIVDQSKQELADDFEFQLKMFMSITRSAIRDASAEIFKNAQQQDLGLQVEQFVQNITTLRKRFRKFKSKVLKQDTQQLTEVVLNYFDFSDEYLSYISQFYCFNLLQRIGKVKCAAQSISERSLITCISLEQAYSDQMGYRRVKKTFSNDNKQVVYRHMLLNKYIESDLDLQSDKRPDSEGVFVQQIYYSLAAGLSMIFATIIAFSFQQKYGNFTMPLFVALVIGYMLKDRIKDLSRFYFMGKLGGKYFDHKTQISIKQDKIGWIKESCDFIGEAKVPSEVVSLRNRSALSEVENKIHNEKILLYRKRIYLNKDKVVKDRSYALEGINEILKFNLTRFTQNMDNPKIKAFTLVDSLPNKAIEIIEVDRTYYIFIIVQVKINQTIIYKRLRITVQRSGVLEFEDLPLL